MEVVDFIPKGTISKRIAVIDRKPIGIDMVVSETMDRDEVAFPEVDKSYVRRSLLTI